MLHLYFSNRTEVLLQALSAVISDPVEAVFQPEMIVVEERGMARWVTQELAELHGISANIEFPQPAGFVWQLMQNQLGTGAAEAGFNKNTLLWYSMAVLPRLKDTQGFESIRSYLSGTEQETKTYQLSQRIAEMFDQYLVYRPDMVLRWEAGEDSHWQAMLWREMRKASHQPHWAGLLQEFKRSLQVEGFKAAGFPERISLFAISSLSPGYIELIGLIAEHIDIHLFLVNPSINYWGDIVSEQDMARLRASWQKSGRADISDLYMVGNPLLASLGKPCRDFIDQWHDYPAEQIELYLGPDQDSLLSMVQADILNLQNRGSDELPICSLPADDSIQVHACHSAMREVQVLHDRLLTLFDSRPDLKPHEIVVMAADINSYAPYIQAVFGAAAEGRQIPFSIADHSAAQEPLIETLLAWILLPDERFEAPTVLGWLELPSVQRRFGLDADAVERIRQWVAESGIRWGLNAGHKLELGLPEDEVNTWAFGFRRMLLGYAMPESVDLYQHIATYPDIEGGDSIWLGQLQAFIEQLAAWRKRLVEPADVRGWLNRINLIIEQFFQPSEREEVLINEFRSKLASMVETAELAEFDGSLSAQVIHQYCTAMLSSGGSVYRLLNGKVSFCKMVPARSIPFRVVCMLGMNDGEFPRNQSPLGFDLIASQPRKGDRLLREDDRYLFLESLLAAREVVHISYVGRSQQDNSARLASVVVTELLDYIQQAYRVENGEKRKSLLIEHPLQPFSPRSYEIGSYASEWLERTDEVEPFAAQAIEQADSDSGFISLDEVLRFIANPARHFLQQTLGIHSAEYEESLEDSECFQLDALTAYQIKDLNLQALLAGEDIAQNFALLQARGELPHGAFAQQSFTTANEGLADLSEEVKQHLLSKEPAAEISLQLADISLSGWLPVLVNGGVFRYRPAKFKAKDQLTLWVEHLVNCANGGTGSSTHLATDCAFSLAPIARESAIQQLEQLIALYRQGQRQALPFFPASSIAFATEIHQGGSVDNALSAAIKKWESGMYHSGDCEDPWFEQAFRGTEPLNEGFQILAREVLSPMLAVAQQEKRR